MKTQVKNKIISLIDELRTFKCSEQRENDIMLELDLMLADPNWSDYII